MNRAHALMRDLLIKARSCIRLSLLRRVFEGVFDIVNVVQFWYVEHATHVRMLVLSRTEGKMGRIHGPSLPKRIGPGAGSGSPGPVQNKT
ncbi:hypothetical protein L195_g045732 [Trifolium pratense]|uniref:Uncharacterized protein n=1 Tax=Trifolium pratense TaxID=57577 RepID=A0A2K3MFP3_TRIPR|nr:hypothetical protein L195_g045732 [Trifolium pratense]